MLEELKQGRIFAGRVTAGKDAVEAITEFAKSKGIRFAKVSGIGAFEKVKLGYFDGEKYHYKSFDEPIEVASMEGNISIKDGELFAHLHINVADKNFNSYAGHLFESEVFCLEFFIQEYIGHEYVRATGHEIPLSVWGETI